MRMLAAQRPACPLEEEALAKAKEEAERKATQGYQRQQPVRKRKKK